MKKTWTRKIGTPCGRWGSAYCIAVLSSTRLGERFALRVGHTNHRTRREDFDLLVREVRRLGGQLNERG